MHSLLAALCSTVLIMSAMDELAWEDPPSLLDDSEVSALDSSHVSQVDDDDGEMELSSSLNLSLSSVSDSEDDRTPLFPKANPRSPATAELPPLSHLTERQQLAYLMRSTLQQRRQPTTSQQPKRHTAPLPPPHPLHAKPKLHLSTTATAKQSTKPSMLTHDKKRRRTNSAAIDPDDSHLYSVQRVPQDATAPAPLPAPVEYGEWSVERRRRWDRLSEQPGLYYYHHTAPGVDTRPDDWSEDEVELLLHLLVCHPVVGGGRKGGATEWGLFSINLPGRVGAECERKWRELTAAGRVASADKFDYMRWYERQRRIVRGVQAKVDNAGAPIKAEVEASSAAESQSVKASAPTVVNRRRVGAPAPPPAADNAKAEVMAASQHPAVQPEPAVVHQQTAAVEQAQHQGHAQPAEVTDKKERVRERLPRREKENHRVEVREQPPRKKTVRFQPPPTTPTHTKTPSIASPTVELTTQTDDIPRATSEPAARPPSVVASRRTPPTRVAIPQLPTLSEDEPTQSALWPPRPPRTPIAASPVPSAINAHSTTSNVIKRLDTTHLTVDRHTHTECHSQLTVSSAHITFVGLLLSPLLVQSLELHMLRAQAAHEVRKARLLSFAQAELARIQWNSLPHKDHSSIGQFRVNAARLSQHYFCQPVQSVEELGTPEQQKLVRALNVRIAMMQADVEREYRLQCDMLNALYAAGSP